MSSEASSFQGLIASIQQAHDAFAAQASKAVNVSLTLRNWFIGYYIAEFELQGADRANYGDKLLTELAKALRAQAVSNSGRRQLYGYLAFYRAYPQIVRTASALSAQVVPRPLLEQKVRTVSAPSPTVPGTDPETLIARLSYSHLEQLVELGDPLQRAFYEVEALRGNWSVRELKRQIAPSTTSARACPPTRLLLPPWQTAMQSRSAAARSSATRMSLNSWASNPKR